MKETFITYTSPQEVVVDEAKEEILNEKEKLMIFTTGSRTYQAHQIGIKLMSKVKFRTKLNIPENIFEAAEEARRKREEERESQLGRINFEPTPWSDYRQVAQLIYKSKEDYRQVAQIKKILRKITDRSPKCLMLSTFSSTSKAMSQATASRLTPGLASHSCSRGFHLW